MDKMCNVMQNGQSKANMHFINGENLICSPLQCIPMFVPTPLSTFVIKILRGVSGSFLSNLFERIMHYRVSAIQFHASYQQVPKFWDEKKVSNSGNSVSVFHLVLSFLIHLLLSSLVDSLNCEPQVHRGFGCQLCFVNWHDCVVGHILDLLWQFGVFLEHGETYRRKRWILK